MTIIEMWPLEATSRLEWTDQCMQTTGEISRRMLHMADHKCAALIQGNRLVEWSSSGHNIPPTIEYYLII
jgi:hypothetical protein